MTGPVDPDCAAGKHPACPGYTFDETPDGDLLEVPCACTCHHELHADPDPPGRVSVAIVCHCGERFDIDRLDEAQAHIHAHAAEPGSEPS